MVEKKFDLLCKVKTEFKLFGIGYARSIALLTRNEKARRKCTMHEIQRAIEDEIIRKTKVECQQQLTELRHLVKEIQRTVLGLQKENRSLRAELEGLRAESSGVKPRRHSPIPRVSGEGITRLRKRQGLSETDLACLFGVTLVTVSRWEHDQQGLRPAMRMKVGKLRKLNKSAVRQLLAEKRRNAAESKKA